MSRGSSAEARLGLSRGRARSTTDTCLIPGSLLTPNPEMGGVTARLRLGTLDKLRFLRSGCEADAQVHASRRRLGAADDHTKLSASFDAAFTFAFRTGPHSIQANARGAGSA